MGSSKGSTTQVQKTEPWAGAQPYLENIYSRAEDLYQNQELQPFGSLSPEQKLQRVSSYGMSPDRAAEYGLTPGNFQTAVTTGVAPFTGAERAAQQGAMQFGMSPLSPLYGQAGQTVGETLEGGGLNPLSGSAANFYGRTLAGQTEPAQMMRETAGGGFLGSNPYLEGMYQASTRPVIEQFTEQILPALDTRFNMGGAGALGSDDHKFWTQRAAGDLTRNLSETAANLYGGAYENERSRMEGARNALAGLYGQAASGLGGLGQASTGNVFQAAQLAPQLAGAERQALLQNLDVLGQTGTQQRAMAEELLGQAMGTYDQSQMAPYQHLGMYSDIVSGLPSSGMGSVTSSQPYYRNRTAGALGGGLSGAMMGGALGSAVPGFGTATGAALGGGLGLLGGLF